MTYTEALTEFLTRPDIVEFLDTYNLHQLYEAADVLSASEISTLTEILLSCNINPLNYLKEVPDYYLMNSDCTKIILPPTITCIGQEAFNLCDNLIEIDIPNSVISLGNDCFSNCESLSRVTFDVNNSNLKYVDLGAFARCCSLTNIVLPNKVQSIESYVFYECYSLQSVTIPPSVTELEDHIFTACPHSLVVTCKEDSPIHHYCIEQGVKVNLI